MFLHSSLRDLGRNLGLHAFTQQVEGFTALSGEISLVSQQRFEVYNVLIDYHACNAAGKIWSVKLLDYWVNSVSNEVLSIVGINNGVKLSWDLFLWEWENMHWHMNDRCSLMRLGIRNVLSILSLVLIVIVSSEASTRIAASASSVVVSSVIIVIAPIVTTTLIILLRDWLLLLLLLLIIIAKIPWLTREALSLIGESTIEDSLHELVSSSILLPGSLLLLLLLRLPHLDNYGGVTSEHFTSVKALNSFLGVSNSVIKNIGKLSCLGF